METTFSIPFRGPSPGGNFERRSLTGEDHGNTTYCLISNRLVHEHLLTADTALLILIALLLIVIVSLWLFPNRIPGFKKTLLAAQRREVAALSVWGLQIVTFLLWLAVSAVENWSYCDLKENISISRLLSWPAAFLEVVGGGYASSRCAKLEVEEASEMDVEMGSFGHGDFEEEG